MNPSAMQSLAAAVRKAVEADMQQSFTNALTPDRGYDEVPIDNTMKVFTALAAEVERLTKEIEDVNGKIERAKAVFSRISGMRSKMSDDEIESHRSNGNFGDSEAAADAISANYYAQIADEALETIK